MRQKTDLMRLATNSCGSGVGRSWPRASSHQESKSRLRPRQPARLTPRPIFSRRGELPIGEGGSFFCLVLCHSVSLGENKRTDRAVSPCCVRIARVFWGVKRTPTEAHGGERLRGVFWRDGRHRHEIRKLTGRWAELINFRLSFHLPQRQAIPRDAAVDKGDDSRVLVTGVINDRNFLKFDFGENTSAMLPHVRPPSDMVARVVIKFAYRALGILDNPSKTHERHRGEDNAFDRTQLLGTSFEVANRGMCRQCSANRHLSLHKMIPCVSHSVRFERDPHAQLFNIRVQEFFQCQQEISCIVLE